MRGAKSLVGVVLLGALLAGCDSGDPATPEADPSQPTAPPSADATATAPVDPFAALVGVQVDASVASFQTQGIVLDDAGHVVVAAGLQVEAGDPATVVAPERAPVDAEVVGADPRSGIAVVRVSDPTGFVPAVFGDSDRLVPGDEVTVVTMAGGPEADRVPGTVRDPATLIGAIGAIEIDVAGFLDGVVTTDDGEVLGLLVASADVGVEVGYAVPANLVRRVADQLVAGERPTYPYLGASVADADGDGVTVEQVVAGGPAAQGGLRQGDVVTALDGRPVGDPGDLVAVVQAAEVGQRVTVTYTRDGATHEVEVTLTAAPD